MHEIDDPHDALFADAPPDPEFTNERTWIEEGIMLRGAPVAFSPPAAVADAPVTEPRFEVHWIDQHRTASYPADPTWPRGCTIDVALDAAQACRVELPYPAGGCGVWVVICRACGYAIALATAGRADDPRSVRVPCRAGAVRSETQIARS